MALSRYKELKDLLSVKLKMSKLRELRTLLLDSRDDTCILDEIVKCTDYGFITKLLVNYNASQNEGDLIIFDILQFYDRVATIDFKPIFPLIFGSNTAEHYQNLVKLGRAIHVCPKPNQVLATLDSTFLWNSGVRVNQFVPGQLEQSNKLLYDPRFVGYLILGTLDAGSELQLKPVVQNNVLSFAVFLLSAHDPSIRAIGYSILGDFLLKLRDISAEDDFEVKPLLVFLLFCIKNNLTNNQRIPHLSANFLARCIKIVLTPEDPIFSRVVTFFHTKFNFKLSSIPEFMTMMMSTSSKTGLQERYWMMQIIHESVLDDEDFVTLENLNGVSLFLSMFSSQFVTKMSIKWTLFVLRKLMLIPLAVKTLFSKYNFHTWVAATIHFKKLTRWEIGFLTQLFVHFLTRTRKVLFQDVEPQCQLKGVKKLKEDALKACLQKVLLILNMEEDDVWRKWHTKLNKLNGKWMNMDLAEFDQLEEEEEEVSPEEVKVDNNAEVDSSTVDKQVGKKGAKVNGKLKNVKVEPEEVNLNVVKQEPMDDAEENYKPPNKRKRERQYSIIV